MRAPKLLRPRPANDTFVHSTEERVRRYASINDDINLSARDVVAALNTVMVTVQLHIKPTVTSYIHQHRYSYSIRMRWQSSIEQLQLEGHADQLGISFTLTNAFGHPYELEDQFHLAWWNCSRDSWDHRGQLNLYRHEKRRPYGHSTYLSTTLPVFEKVQVRKRHDFPSWRSEPKRMDLIDDIVEVTRIYASAF